MKRKYVPWLIGYFLLVLSALGLLATKMVRVDPFFHYHQPETATYFYTLNNQRSQNDGISKHFDYTGLISGTSMTENFKTTEAEALWGGQFIKVSYSGGSYKEINGNIETALRYNPNLKIIIRGLDMSKFVEEKDAMRSDLGKYPTYLYDENPFNDVQYIFNRDVIFNRVYPMIKANDEAGFTPGMTTFDQYANWMHAYKFGKNTLFPEGITIPETGDPVHLTDAEREIVLGTIEQNIVAVAQKYPDVTFYYFITPYSAQWWMSQVGNGQIYRQVEAERLIIEESLKYPNIKLFSFNCRFDLTTDLNHYKDSTHYGEWINSLMLRYMHDDHYLLTQGNYNAYLEEELNFYTSYDYQQMEAQEDYEDDYYAAFLMVRDHYGIEPVSVDLQDTRIELQGAEIVEDQYEGNPGILCTGSLQRDQNVSTGDYMRDTQFVGFKLRIEDISANKYITFRGRKITDHGQPTVYVYDRDGKVVAQCTDSYHDISDEWKEYILNVSALKGEVYVIFNGGYVDNTGSLDSKYIFSDMKIY